MSSAPGFGKCCPAQFWVADIIKYGRELYGQCGIRSEALRFISILALGGTEPARDGEEKVQNIVLRRLMNVGAHPLGFGKDIVNRKYLGSFRAESSPGSALDRKSETFSRFYERVL